MDSRSKGEDWTISPDLPDGQITSRDARRVSSPNRENILLRGLVDAALLIPAVPPRTEGRIAIVTNVGCGMRWTRWRRKTSATDADGEVVWSWHLDADVKLVTMLHVAPVMVTRKPDHQGEHEGNR